VTSFTKKKSLQFYFTDKLGKGIQMIYKLTLKKDIDVKTLVEADTKKTAICYFAALLHLNQKDLLNIFSIR